jgi:serine/threonine protein kinase
MDPLIGRVLLDRYEVLRRIGSGGMGAVYVGRQLAVGREVALKILRADLMNNESVRERFRREAEIIGRLRHPNTIQLIDYGETVEGLAVMVMELLVGQALSDRLKQLGPMPVRDAIRVGFDIAQSLAEAHGLGLVHRDLKPANIFLVDVAGQTHAKVLDFGIARILDEESTRITSTGQVFGTPRYMSPEQGMASGEVDSRTDVYSLGLILFECLVGQPPFVAQTSIQYLSAHATLPAPHLSEHLPGAPRDLEQLIDACLVKDREHRVQTADAVAEALRRILLRVEANAEVIPASTRGPSNDPGLDEPSSIEDLLPPRQEPTDPTMPPRRPPPRREPAPVAPVEEPPERRPLLLAGGAAAVLAGLVLVAALLLKPGPKVDPVDVGIAASLAVDAGAAAAERPVRDAGSAVALLVTGAPDAGAAEATKLQPDAGTETADAPDSGAAPRRRRRKTPPPDGPGGDGVITGPRGMIVPIAEDDSPAVAAAKTCKASKVSSGDAKLTLSRCPSKCAVLIDRTCAGQTPLKELGTTPGNKSIEVVCKGKLVVDSIARLRSGSTFELSCK